VVFRKGIRMTNVGVTRSSIKITNGEYTRLKHLSELLGIPMGAIVTIVLTDGYVRYQSGIIKKEIADRGRPNALREENEEEMHVIKFTIAIDIYYALRDYADSMTGRMSKQRVTVKNIFSSWFEWYCEYLFKFLLVSYDELHRKNINENAVSAFYESKSNYYGVPLSSIKSFYLAELLNMLMKDEYLVNITGKYDRINTDLFTDGKIEEW